MRLLFVGDTVGNMGVSMLQEYLPKLKRDLKPQITVVNGENATAVGRGISQRVYKQIMSAGADVITLGNHAWNNAEILDFIDQTPNLIRPANYPGPDVPGRGYTIVNVNGKQVAIINLQGLVFMDNLNNPFDTINAILEQVGAKTDYQFIDFHAETTSEKMAIARYLDGRVSALVGTHTHVQTSDYRVLPAGTAFMSDAGMTGPYDSILGMQTDLILKRFITQRPVQFKVAETGSGILSGCVIDLSDRTGLATKIRPILINPDHPYSN
ncbi:TIGR00282 family metallophosphoesterase [Nicoliella spurrieriana]|uniref:TIGR00282 family metallophosphoesterase n=1 Tax=Nicoliella spurrieriana TaxID=2925830 RepID=A0A976RS31_9LACO|nr:TIGR00282 family metallophosphoesterase [Nicoliella spurrieriana]UQS86797.1 TIGR00282 family metallophosphoesterase [Nicoliella spurrieriana]